MQHGGINRCFLPTSECNEVDKARPPTDYMVAPGAHTRAGIPAHTDRERTNSRANPLPAITRLQRRTGSSDAWASPLACENDKDDNTDYVPVTPSWILTPLLPAQTPVSHAKSALLVPVDRTK